MNEGLNRDQNESHNNIINFQAYIDRIGARKKSFRKYVVEAETDEPAYGTLLREVAAITLVDGKLKLKGSDEYLPDKDKGDNVDAINSELEKAKWPKSIPATKAHLMDLIADIGSESELFLYPDRTGKNYVFVQQRIYTKEGKKTDLPWSFWDDAKWRRIEPDGLLPVFGLDLIDSGKPVMFHEGAKTALGARDVKPDHPLYDYLKDYAHVGWPGGANNPHRVDWSPIRDLPAHRRVIGVCDNDQIGVDAVSKISQILGRSLKAVIFDSRFPKTFDLADPWPNRPEWWRGKKYVGPTIRDLIRPATWATDFVKTKGRPKYIIRKQFAEEWIYVGTPGVFVHRTQTDRLLKPEDFNRSVRPFSDVDDTARLLVKHASVQVNSLAYRPDQLPGVIAKSGIRLLNTYLPGDIKPNDESYEPWLEFMAHLFPDETDRKEMMRWCATLIARSDIRILYGVLLISEVQGVGKGTLGEKILAPLVGPGNVSFPSEMELVDSAFNSWLAHRRLVVAHEIYAGHSRAAYNKLKSSITDKMLNVNRKGIEAYPLENFIHVFACSNSIKAMFLDKEDRRWFVPKVTEEKKDHEYWKKLNQWLNSGGLGAIKRWADEYVKEEGNVVEEGMAPPTSTMKEKVVAESRTPGARLAYDLAKKVVDSQKKIVLADDNVRSWVKDARGIYDDTSQKIESALTLRKAMIEAGLNKLDGKRFTIKTKNGATIQSSVVANFDILPDANWKELKDFFVEARELWEREEPF